MEAGWDSQLSETWETPPWSMITDIPLRFCLDDVITDQLEAAGRRRAR